MKNTMLDLNDRAQQKSPPDYAVIWASSVSGLMYPRAEWRLARL